jgi:hypothetical protein
LSRRSVVQVALVISFAALLVAGCGDDGEEHPSATPTVAPPFTERIRIEKSALAATSTTHGTCEQHASVRHDVWRCTVEPLPDTGATLISFCVSETPADTFVLCVLDAFAGADAVRVDLDMPLPERTDDDGFTALAVELEDGTECSFIGGATFVVGDERANFHCSDDSWLIGNPLLGDDGSWTWPQCREECGGESPPEEAPGTARAVRVLG